MKYLNTLEEISASFTAKEHRIELGNCEECKMPFHIHPSAELLLTTSGELTVTILGNEPEKIPQGKCALIFPFQSHSYERPEGVEYFRFNFSPSLIKSFFSPNERKIGERAVFPINIDDYRSFLSSVRGGSISAYKVKGFLYNIVADYANNIAFIEKPVDNSAFAKVISYINEHKSDKLTLSEVAQALGYHEKHLSRSINNAAGFGFSTLLSMLRIEAASDLLRNTDRTVVDIATDCGFGSERNFYRIFKELTGYTPNEFRLSSPKKPAIDDAVLKKAETN